MLHSDILVIMTVDTVFDVLVERSLGAMRRLHDALAAAQIPYEVVGGMAVFLHVERVDPERARLTRDINCCIRRIDLERIPAAVAPYGLVYRRVAGVDMLLDQAEPKARKAIHLLMAGERVRPEDPEPVPDLGSGELVMGARITSIDNLLRMKLTSFRLKDQVHVQDLDGAGLITASMEAALSPVLRDRLAQVRAAE